MGFLSELKRRNVFRVAIAYVVIAWLLLQVGDTLAPALRLPDWVNPTLVFFLVLGFPLAIFFAWVYELTPEGLKREKDVVREASITHVTAKRLDVLTIGLIVVALIFVVTERLWFAPTPESQEAATAVVSADATQSEVEKSPYTPNSIAVLPFVNLSPDSDNSYFADGLTEELLNGLSNVDGLRVIARTSSFSFKDKNVDVREIGRKLGVSNLLEGSVRVAGDTIRVTAQLVDSEDGVHLWSKTYDRPKADVLFVQDDIASNIVRELKGELLDSLGTPVSTATTQNIEAYSQYLQGRALLRRLDMRSDPADIERAMGLFRVATEIDPEFADAFVALADGYRLLSWKYDDFHELKEAEESLALARDAGKIAIELAPQSSEAMRALGMLSDEPEEMERAFRQAIEFNPNNAEAYLQLGLLQMEQGFLDEGADLVRIAYGLDPLKPSNNLWLARVLLAEGDLKEASVYFRLNAELVGHSEWFVDRMSGEDFSVRDKPTNLDFEEGLAGWRLLPACGDWYALSSSEEAFTGLRSARLGSLPNSAGWCGNSQRFPAEPFRGKYLRIVSMLKTRGMTDYAVLFLRVDGENHKVLGINNGWLDLINEDADWTEYERRLYIPPDSMVVWLGVVLVGEGEVLMDSFRLETSDNKNFD